MLSINGITINFKPPSSETKSYRGLHVLVISPNGLIETTRIFDTYKCSRNLELFIKKFVLPDGYIIAVGCRNECVSNLSLECMEWF